MSILIKGMEIPKGCSGCCISFAMEGHYCQAVLEPNDAVEGGMAWKETPINERPSWCPLEEVPELATNLQQSCNQFATNLQPTAQPEPCGDVVSRNAIIQKLNTMDRYVSEELRLCDTDKKFPQNEVFIVDDVYEEIVEQLPSAQPETQWIPCSERLPKMDGKYVITEVDGCVTCDCFRNGDWKITFPIAWMPLPEPYAERRTDDLQ